MADNLMVFFEEQQALYTGLKDTASTALVQLNGELAAALEAHAAVVTQLSEQTRAIAAKRTAMSAGDLMPADIELLAAELRTLLITQRKNHSALLAAADQVALLRLRKGSLEQRIKDLGGRIKQIEADLAEATEQQSRHTAWAERITEGEVAALQSQATALLDALADDAVIDPEGDPDLVSIAAAKARIEADIPEVLLDRARQRGAYLSDQIDARSTSLDTLTTQFGNQRMLDFCLEGTVAEAWQSFSEAEDAYAAVVARGQARYDQAVSRLAAVNASPALTAAEQTRITDLALAADADALVNEQARDAAQAAVAAKYIDIEEAIVAALLADVDADPETDATVQDERTQLGPLETALANAEAAFDASMQEALSLWQGAVPDRIWNNLVNYDLAVETLSELRDADLSTLETDLSTAEDDLMTALEDEDRAERLDAALAERHALSLLRVGDMLDAARQHLTGAMRGDEGYHTSFEQGEIL